MREVVTDKGYHSGPSVAAMRAMGIRSYISVPQQPRRNWKGKTEQQVAVYANTRRVEGERGKRLMRRRGEFLERPFAHQYETGALRRVHVRGRGNVAKRVLLQAAAFNLALILRSITKAGTPKGLADLKTKLLCALWRILAAVPPPFAPTTSSVAALSPISPGKHTQSQIWNPVHQECRNRRSDTGC
jgi:transposase